MARSRRDGGQRAVTLRETAAQRPTSGDASAKTMRRRRGSSVRRDQTVVERGSETFNAYDRRDAERDAEEKDAQAGEPAAQIANGETPYRRARADSGRERRVHTATAAELPRTLPERRRIVRSQRAASAASWVTSASVAAAPGGRIEHQIDDCASPSSRRGCRSARRRSATRAADRALGRAQRAAARRPKAGRDSDRGGR